MSCTIKTKEWFGICAMFFRVRVEESIRNASCFMITFRVSNQLPKEASKSNPVLVE